MAHLRVRRRVLLGTAVLLAALAWLAVLAGASRAQDAGVIQLRQVVDGLASPVFVTHAGDGSGRLFVVEQNGAIRIVKNGVLAAQPFLDIHDRVVQDGGEAGLLGVAFPPDYPQSGYFFVSYNHMNPDLVPPPPEDAGTGEGYDTVIARFRVTADPDRADPASEERLLVRNQPYPNHNGGLIAFGPDGYLYVGLGDGGSGGDPLNSGQRLDTLLGKILRIQVGASGAYTIPAGNPFVGTAAAKPEIWDLGLRNPWRWSFDRATGDLYIGDVGQGAYEEISFHPAAQAGGLNFGWKTCEGTHGYPDDSQPCPSSFTPPILEYGHDEGCSVSGGYVYRGPGFPNLHGRYFFGDYCTGLLWSTQKTSAGFAPRRLELDTPYAISSFGEDEQGEVYVVDYGGGLYRLVDGRPPPSPTPLPNPDVFLPGTQPGSLVDEIANPSTCQACHTEPIYGAWRGSMMAQAGRDPVFWAALHVANDDIPGVGEYCLRCHTPLGWFAGHSHPGDGSALTASDIAAGVACETCHRMVDPRLGAIDEAAAYDAAVRAAISPTLPANHAGSAMLILDPADNRRGPFTVTPSPHPKATWRTDFLGQGGDPVMEARVCGTCHNVDNPTLSWDPARQQYWPNAAGKPAPSFAAGDLFPIERTYDEWLHSSYAEPAGVYAPQFAGSKPGGIVHTCQDCHMPRGTGLAATDGVARDCRTNGCLPEHLLMGGNTWVPQLLQDTRWRLAAPAEGARLDKGARGARAMLVRSATLTMTLSVDGDRKFATVRVINETGHKLPTGYPEGRRLWLSVQAYDATGRVIFSSGHYTPATGVLDADPWLKVYEAKQGLTPELAADLGHAAGATFHFALNNTTVKDNRIPPRGYTQAAWDQPGLRPVGAAYADGQYWDDTVYPLPPEAVAVTALLYYQTASKEYVDFLRAEGGADGVTLGQLWDDLPSPPEVIAVAMDPERPLFLPLLGK